MMMKQSIAVLMALMTLLPATPAAAEPNQACLPGITNVLATSNANGEILTAWAQSSSSEGVCQSVTTRAAVGSPASGFRRLGAAFPAGALSKPTGVALDVAGDAWVVGDHMRPVPGVKYGLHYEPIGAWAAFRPAGGSFKPPVQLSSTYGGESETTTPMAACDGAGTALIAWTVRRGSYAAWATASGDIQRARFFGGKFQVTSVSVDEAGQGLLVGVYPTASADETRALAATAASAYGRFARPRMLVRPHRPGVPKWPKRRFSLPLTGVAPSGRAVILYTTFLKTRRGHEKGRPERFVYRRANGTFSAPKRLPKGFHGANLAVENAGSALIVGSGGPPIVGRRPEELTIAADGQISSHRRLPGKSPSWYLSQLAGNATGQAILGWVRKLAPDSLGILELDSSGAHGIFTEIPSGRSDFALTMDPAGTGTILWVQALGSELSNDNRLYARTTLPGAATVEVASGAEGTP